MAKVKILTTSKKKKLEKKRKTALVIPFFFLFQLVPEHVLMTPEEKTELLQR